MKTLLVVLDGSADGKHKSLSGKTPLESASMPNLDSISGEAFKWMMYPVGKGIAPESDAAVFSILSYDVRNYSGRGPVEAVGAGLEVNPNTLAIRCNFATIDKNRNIIDRRAGRIDGKDPKSLEKEINSIDLGIKGVSFRFKSTVGYRGVCAFYPSDGQTLSSNISNADIGYIRKGNISVAVKTNRKRVPRVSPLDKSKAAKFSSMVVNSFIDKVIEKLSKSKINAERKRDGLMIANALLLRDAGLGLPKLRSLSEKYERSFAFIAEMPVEIGISKILGMDAIKLGIISDRRLRYKKMADLAKRSLDRYDFVYVHIKGPDEPGHDGNSELKKEILEEIDANFFSLVKRFNCDICITADHATPCPMKAHSADPVPVITRYEKNRSYNKNRFDESFNKDTRYIKGTQLLPIILK